MIKTVKHYVQPDVRNLMGLESGSPLCTSDPQPGEAGNYDSNDDIIYDDIF